MRQIDTALRRRLKKLDGHQCSSLYYDRAGRHISPRDWCIGFENIYYKRVAYTTIRTGRISTVWLGLDHNWGGNPPLIFESMVFPTDSTDDLDCVRYATEAEALAGHAALVLKWKDYEQANNHQ